MKDILNNLPPSSVNNSREIVRKKLQRMKEYPSETLAQSIENLAGIDCDYSNADNGEGPKR